ncbi:MAG: MarR family transcriptional regulator [Fibrobacteria bacterium]
MLAIDEGVGKFTQQDLADILEIDKVLMVGILNYLSENGFVERKQNKEDGRKHRIVLTGKAKAALPEIRKTISDLNRQALSELPANLAENFPEILRLIRGSLENLQDDKNSSKKRPARNQLKSRSPSRGALKTLAVLRK